MRYDSTMSPDEMWFVPIFNWIAPNPEPPKLPWWFNAIIDAIDPDGDK